jgi:prenyltransferase beta subunit
MYVLITLYVRRPDFYHTCYGLSGLSVAQHRYMWAPGQEIQVVDSQAVVFGAPENIIVRLFL